MVIELQREGGGIHDSKSKSRGREKERREKVEDERITDSV
jgi:hypothetical protein